MSVAAQPTRSASGPEVGSPSPGGRSLALRANILAALTAACIVAPECVAFAQLAGIPAERGLVVAPVAILAYVLIGGSRTLYVTPLAATAILTAVTVSSLGVNAQGRMVATAAVALGAGVILLITGIARCGFIVHFLRPEAVTGFLFGLAVVVIIRELAIATTTNLGEGSAATRAIRLLGHITRWHPASVLFTVVAFGLLLGLERWRPAIPSTLVVLAAGWGLNVLAGLDRHGIEVVGHIPNTFPVFSVPDLSRGQWSDLVGGSLGLALICFVLSFGVATRLADPDDPPLNPNREMLALGVSNVFAGLVGGLAGAGSPEASPAAKAVGANRRWSLMVAAVALFALAGWGTTVFEQLPEAALAAVVIAAVRGFVSPAPLIAAWHRDRAGFAVALCAVAGVVVLGLLQGLLIAVGLSFVLFVATASRLHVSELGRAETTSTYLAVERFPELVRHDSVLILRPDGGLFFANIDRVTTEVQKAVAGATSPPQVVLLDLGASFRLDQPTVAGLTQMRDALMRRQVALHFVHLYLEAADAIAISTLRDVPAHQDIVTAINTLAPLPSSTTTPMRLQHTREAGQ